MHGIFAAYYIHAEFIATRISGITYITAAPRRPRLELGRYVQQRYPGVRDAHQSSPSQTNATQAKLKQHKPQPFISLIRSLFCSSYAVPIRFAAPSIGAAQARDSIRLPTRQWQQLLIGAAMPEVFPWSWACPSCTLAKKKAMFF